MRIKINTKYGRTLHNSADLSGWGSGEYICRQREMNYWLFDRQMLFMRSFYFIQWYSWYARIWEHLTHTWVRKMAVANPNTNMGHNSLPMTLGTVWTATTPAWTVTHTSNVNLQYLFRCSFVKARLPTGDKLKRKIVSFELCWWLQNDKHVHVQGWYSSYITRKTVYTCNHIFWRTALLCDPCANNNLEHIVRQNL